VKDLGVFAYKENVAPEFTNNGVADKANVGDVVLNRLTQSLDKSSLYNINPDAPNGYVIETDPRFANKQKWLSSDYMLNALQYSPDNMHKRLGDGFYELRLVNEQINQLTGRRYLEGYQNDLEQYQGLMNNGVHYAKKLNLVPGVALTEKQMSELTTDLVWMVNEEVTLPGGKKLNVLTPKIYLASNRAQVAPTGAVISGDSIVAKVTSMNNEGTLIASDLVNVYGQDLQNKGVVLADNVNLNADQKLVNLGGKIMAADSLSLYGGKSVELGATTTETQSQLGRTETGNKQVDRQSELKVTGKDGELSIQSGGDITIKAANVKSAGTVDVNAKGKLLVTTEKQSSKEHYDFSDNHHYHLDKEGEVSSVIEGKEGTRLVGQEETTLRQAKVNSEEGRTIIASQGEVKLEEGRDIEHLDRRNKQTSKGFLTKETEEMRRHHDYDLSKGSEVNGKDVIVYSQDANATVKGSSITAQDGLLVQAKNVNVKEAENNAYVEEHYEKKRSGLATSFKGGVAKIGYEKSKSNLDSKSISLEAAGSQLTGGTTTLAAENVLTVRGSDLNSQEQSDLRAKQVNLEAAKEVHHTEVHQSSKTSGFGLSMVYDPTLKAIDQYKQRQKQGGTETVVGKINSIAEAGADAVELMSRGIVPYLEHKRSKSDKTTIETTAKVTAVNAGGQLNVVASEGDIRTQGTQIAAEKGATFLASNNIELGTAENTYTQQANTSDKGFSLGDANKYLFGVHTQRENGDATQTQEVSTTISVGGNNQIVAQKGDIHAKGAKIVSEGKNQLSAAGNVVLDTAVTTQETTQQRKGHAVGEAVISDSERFYGYNRTRFNQDGNFTHHEKAQLASLGDKVEVYAGKDYRQTSAEILSKDKASINAQNIIVDSAFNTDKYKQSESDLKFGQFTRVKSPIIDLINSIESTVKNKKASDRVQAANIMSVAAQAYNLASAFQGQGGASYLIRVESGTGVAHSRKKEDSYQHTSQGNLFNAKEIEFTARGDGSTNAQGNPQLGNINITHADITSVDEKGNRLKDSSVTFNANNLTIDPGKSTVDQHARSQSAGVEVGMAATIGAQTGIGIYARVGGSSSKTNVEGVNYTNSHLNTETLNINTQGDTTLTGTTAKAKTINANVGGNLNIASVQDENKFETKSSGGGLEVEFGWGNNWRVSGYGNSEKGESGYKQVKEQAGLFAEEGGYHVNAKNVHLKGAAITSTNPANSELATNKLTFEDIQNESHSDAMSMSFSASYSQSGGTPKDNSSSGSSPFSQIGSKMKDSFSSNGPTSSSTNFGGGLPMNESDSDNSVTRATLTEGKITLNKDTAPMQTTAQALGINTDINQANGEVDTPKDVNQILSEQRQISTAIGNIKSAVDTYTSNKLREAETVEQQVKAEYDNAKANNASEEELGFLDFKLMEANRDKAKWEYGGGARRAIDTITTLFTGVLSGQSASATTIATLSPTVNKLIADNTNDKVTNALAHAVWGAIEAQVNGGNAAQGAITASSAELLAPQIASILYGKEEVDLTPDEKAGVISMASLAGGIAGALMNGKADSMEIIGNAAINAQIAENTVTNNHLSEVQKAQRKRELDACDGWRCRLKVGAYWAAVDVGQDASFSAGLAMSIPEGVYETGAGLYEFAKNPSAALNAIGTLIKEGKMVDTLKQSYLDRINTIKENYNKAGAEGSYRAGVETGKLLQETLGLIAGGAGVAKAGAKLAKTATNVAKNVAKPTTKVINGGAVLTKIKPNPKQLNIVCGIGNKCFVAGTLIETVNGLKPIEEIQYGELIWSREEFGEKYAYKPVFANKVTLNQETFKVVVKNESGKTESFITTAEHPFFVEGKGWLKAILLEEDMVLLDRNGLPSLQVVSQQATGKLETVYNIAVEEFSTYHVGEFGVWVHNANCCDFVNVKYGDIEAKFKQGGWVNSKNDRVMYIDPFDGKFKDFPDGARASVDHILPQSAFNKIDGFDKLPKYVQNELINHPKNLQPLPKELNSSKGAKIETGTEGWQRYVKENKDISPLYRKYLANRQDEIRSEVLVAIKKFGVNK